MDCGATQVSERNTKAEIFYSKQGLLKVMEGEIVYCELSRKEEAFHLKDHRALGPNATTPSQLLGRGHDMSRGLILVLGGTDIP